VGVCVGVGVGVDVDVDVDVADCGRRGGVRAHSVAEMGS
jgi:hypothetical protein